MCIQVADYNVRVKSKDFPWEIQIYCEEEWIVNQLKKIFSCFDLEACCAGNMLLCQRDGENYALYMNDCLLQRNIQRKELIGTLVEWILSAFFLHADGYTMFHGTAIQKGQQTWGVVGCSYVGKTTLSLLMLQKGWAIGNDEVCTINRDTIEYVPFPIPVFFRDSSYCKSEHMKHINSLGETEVFNQKRNKIENRKLIQVQAKCQAHAAKINGFWVLQRVEGESHDVTISLLEKADAIYHLCVNNRDPRAPIQVFTDALLIGERVPVYLIRYTDTMALSEWIDTNYSFGGEQHEKE